MFPVRYDLDLYILFRKDSVFKVLISQVNILKFFYGFLRFVR